jgi:hypothetical protein
MSDEYSLADRVVALEQRLEAAEAHQAITNLKSEYGSLADARYTRKGIEPQSVVDAIADRVANLFSEDGVWDGGAGLGRCVGRDAIRERFRRPTLAFSWHFFVKPRIQVEGDTATGTWDIFCPCTTQDGRAMWMVGVEHDEYVQVDGVWLHRKMELDAKLMAPHDRGWA